MPANLSYPIPTSTTSHLPLLSLSLFRSFSPCIQVNFAELCENLHVSDFFDMSVLLFGTLMDRYMADTHTYTYRGQLYTIYRKCVQQKYLSSQFADQVQHLSLLCVYHAPHC